MASQKLGKIRKRQEILVESSFRQAQGCPFKDPKFYAKWLAQHYYYICHSTRLLAASAARFGIEEDRLHVRFLEHTREERHHEKLILRDLQSLGCDIADFSEHPLTSHMYQSQYYLIEHKDPLCLFGYILFLESLSLRVGKYIYDIAQSAFGEKACNFLRVHVHEDEDHLGEAWKVLEGLSDGSFDGIGQSLEQTAAVYEALIESISRQHLGKGHLRSA